MESNQVKQNCESKITEDIMKNPNKVWKEKRKVGRGGVGLLLQ